MTYLIEYLYLAPPVFALAMLAAAAFCYGRHPDRLPSCVRKLVWLSVMFYVLFAALESGLQYYVWSQGEPGNFFLPPYQPVYYFLRYAFMHFWLAFLTAAGLSLGLYLFLRLLDRRRPWLFLAGETELGFVSALLTGWPGFVIFLPLIFFILLPLALLRRLVLKEERTTMGWSFLLAAGIALFFGNYLINLLGLGALKI